MATSVSRDYKTSSSYNRNKRACDSRSVIVIGGGFAGIAAARVLQDASVQVVVLESRDRIGGRVHTDYSLGFPIDLGASWLHGVCKENPLAPIIAKLEMPLYCTSRDNSVLYDHDLESYALFDADGKQVPHELVTGVGKVFELLLKETENVRKDHKEDMSIRKAITMVFQRNPELRLEGLPHKVLQWYLCRMEGWFSADADAISLQGWDQEELLPGGHGLMVQGYLPVIQNLAKGLDIRLNHRVIKVARRSNGVVVTIEDGRIFTADAAVVSVPLGVLKSKVIRFEPPLPKWKELAIDGIGVGLENKIALHFKDAFWPNVDFFGVVSGTTHGCSYFLNLHKASGNPILVYMLAGKLAREIEILSDESAAGFAFSQLKKILPDASSPVMHYLAYAPKFSDMFSQNLLCLRTYDPNILKDMQINYLVSHWGKDKNSLGSYSYDKVGNSHELYEKLRIPVENLFFAGEATSALYPGSVHGAFSTGMMAADECRIHVLTLKDEAEMFRSVMTNDPSNDFSPSVARM